MFTYLAACIYLLLYVNVLCLITLILQICPFISVGGHSLISQALVIKASLFDASTKITRNRNEVLFEANKRRLLALSIKLFILNSFVVNLNPTLYMYATLLNKRV